MIAGPSEAQQPPGTRGAPAQRRGIQAPHPDRKQVLAWGDVRFGQQHDSVTRAMITIERLGRESGLYDTYIRTDSQLITKQPILPAGGGQFPLTNKNLTYFDAIFFFGVREIELAPQQKADLLSFVQDDGKGFVGAHTATTAFFSWPEFGDLIGGRFDNHPWGITDAKVIVEDPAFPGMDALKTGMVVKDEHYEMSEFSRDKVRVLARIDPSSVDLNNPNVHRKDGDFPIAWARTYGKGRVFCSTLGHATEYWDQPHIQQMYFGAMKWALGLAQGDATPRPKPNPSAQPV